MWETLIAARFVSPRVGSVEVDGWRISRDRSGLNFESKAELPLPVYACVMLRTY